MTVGEIIGHYFFEDNNRDAVTVTEERYRATIRELLHPTIPNKLDLRFQHYWATDHTARKTMQLLTQCFGDGIISLYGNINWPPRSLDLTSPDFIPLEYLIRKVYVNKSETPEQLKGSITNKIRKLNRNQETLKQGMKND